MDLTSEMSVEDVGEIEQRKSKREEERKKEGYL
jgi:hypothetical protein